MFDVLELNPRCRQAGIKIVSFDLVFLIYYMQRDRWVEETRWENRARAGQNRDGGSGRVGFG
jgi:hypothetical protein